MHTHSKSFPIQLTEKSTFNDIDWDNLAFGKTFSDHMFLMDYENGAWVNGKVMPFQPIPMHPAMSAIHYGQSIFEGLKAYKSKNGQINIFRPELNAVRFAESAKRMCMPEVPESIFLEAGRVGRDGEFSRAISYLEKEDMGHLMDSFNLKFPSAEVVKAIYKAICSYLKIAIGSGKDETYPIDLIAFKKLYKFDLISTYNALQLLALNGDVTFSESFFKPSNMKFTIGNLELYNFQLQHDKYSPLITLLSRNHSGIFESFKVINEGQICKLLKISKNELVDQLSSMEKQGILEINWQTTLPTITFIRERLPDDYLNLSFEIYGERKENALEKLTKVQQFIESKTCRSIELLRYFGQEISPCGHCDNCLKKNGDEQSESLRNELLSFINSPKTYLELCAQFPFDIEQLKNTIRLLQHEGKLTFNKDLFSL